MVDTARREQLLMRSRLSELPLVQHQDAVHPLNRRQTVRDGDRRSSAHNHLQRLADQQLRLGVDARRCLVENQHRRVERERTGKRQQLLLPDRQRGAALGHRRVQALRQPIDKCVGVDGRDGAPHAVIVDRPVAEPDVAGDRAREQVHVLQHQAESCSEAG